MVAELFGLTSALVFCLLPECLVLLVEYCVLVGEGGYSLLEHDYLLVLGVLYG